MNVLPLIMMVISLCRYRKYLQSVSLPQFNLIIIPRINPVYHHIFLSFCYPLLLFKNSQHLSVKTDYIQCVSGSQDLVVAAFHFSLPHVSGTAAKLCCY